MTYRARMKQITFYYRISRERRSASTIERCVSNRIFSSAAQWSALPVRCCKAWMAKRYAHARPRDFLPFLLSLRVKHRRSPVIVSRCATRDIFRFSGRRINPSPVHVTHVVKTGSDGRPCASCYSASELRISEMSLFLQTFFGFQGNCQVSSFLPCAFNDFRLPVGLDRVALSIRTWKIFQGWKIMHFTVAMRRTLRNKRVEHDKDAHLVWRRYSFSAADTCIHKLRCKFQTESRATCILYSRRMLRSRRVVFSSRATSHPPCIGTWHPERARCAGNAELSLLSGKKSVYWSLARFLSGTRVYPWLTSARSRSSSTLKPVQGNSSGNIRRLGTAQPRRRKFLSSFVVCTSVQFWPVLHGEREMSCLYIGSALGYLYLVN